MLKALAFKASYIKLVGGRPMLSMMKIKPQNLDFGNIWLMAIFKVIAENECINESALTRGTPLSNEII